MIKTNLLVFESALKLDKEILNKLVEKITVGEKQRTDDNITVQKVKIFYRFVGNYCNNE